MSDIVLVGYSGHGLVVADSLLQMGVNIVGYLDKREIEHNPYRLPYLGFENNSSCLEQIKQNRLLFFVAIGDNSIRRKVFHNFVSEQLASSTVFHPSCIVSDKGKIGVGTFIGPRAIVNSMAIIGTGVILNTGCIVEHECLVEDFVHVAPGAVLAGSVRVGEGSFIGAGSVIKNGVSIGNNVVIGAGAVVVKDIADNQVWFGNPAKRFIR
jgi:sugar O-acyltransferase (sialic acid O-acetyltransferase NeuD family)